MLSSLIKALRPGAQSLKHQIAELRSAWRQSPYYDDAERWTHLFWSDDAVFRRMFDTLDLTNVVELACGRGRHAAQAAPRCDRLTLIDLVSENVVATQARMAAHDHVEAMVGDGESFRPLPDHQYSAIYSYDSMVHFDPVIVNAYLVDAKRILAPGGRALFHHSNYTPPHPRHYGENPHARNAMTQERFRDMATAAGLSIVESNVIDWGRATNLDCVTLCAA